MPNESVKPASILTEEELKVIESKNYGLTFWESCDNVTELIASHRSLNSRNLKLVLENDELMAENQMHIRYERYLVLLIDNGAKLEEDHDFEWFKQLWENDVNKSLEETK